MSSMMRRSQELLEVASNFRVQPSVTDEIVHHFFSSLDTPKSLACWLLYSSKEHDQLLDLSVNPNDYQSGYRFRLDYDAVNFLSKSVFLKTSFDKEIVAFKKFHQFEELCKSTNDRFRSPLLDPLNQGSNVWLLNATKRKIAQILGDFSGEELVDEANWGPGVSTLLKGEEVSAYNKFLSERGITRDLYSFVGTWFFDAYPSWALELSLKYGDNPFLFQVGNKIVTVPKNSKTDRVIAIEPGLNLWFQKGFGSMIRRRLSRVGIDLNSQLRNQQLAKSGSLSGLLATVDFSSASDSIARELVRELLPPKWFTVMDLCRSKIGISEDKTLIHWEKFSSMGNGFTFELESLIFYAAASAVLELRRATYPGVVDVSVYGDDVILPTDCFESFSSFSAFLGFRVNEKKSFFSGPFRESCGEHFFDGVTCKPIFLKERLRYVESFYKLANSLRNLSHRYGFYRSCDSRFLSCWSHLVRRIPEPLRFRVPLSAGDTGLVSNFDEACPTRARDGIEGYRYRALTSQGLTRDGDSFAILLARLRAPGAPMANNSYPLRGRSKRRLTTSLVSQWYNLGEWAS
jgi:hypothetical protein